MSKVSRSFFKIFLIFTVVVLAVTNTWVLYKFLNWISEFESTGSVAFDFASYLAVQAHQNSLLQVYLVVYTLGLGAVALWGYTAIKIGAENRAEEIAKRTADNILKKYIEQLETHKELVTEISDRFKVKSMPQTEMVTEMKENNNKGET